MHHRTYGETRDCKGCRFWSEMCARAEGNTVVALCINSASPKSMTYTAPFSSCDAWKDGTLGAIDTPGPDNMVALYARMDAESTNSGAVCKSRRS